MSTDQPTNPMKAIRAKCLDCSGGSPSEVRECLVINCALHPFRLGKNPFRKKRELSEEQLAALKERMAKARGVKQESITDDELDAEDDAEDFLS